MTGYMKTWLAAGLLAVAGAALPALAQTDSKPAEKTDAKQAEAKPTQDVIIFRNGTVRYGKVLSETAIAVKFKGTAAGMEFETDNPKDEILEIKRGVEVKAGTAAPEIPAGKVESKTAKATEEVADDGTKTKYYWVELKGDIGEEISETPIHKVMLDARDNKAEVVVFNLDATWVDKRSGRELEDFEGSFDQLRRATAMMQVLVNDVPVDFGGKPPRVVFWVKQAMGGAAFLPLVSREIYFHPEGKLGGIGNLDRMMTGHERGVEKQISLRLQRAAGWANIGGYPEELVRALALTRTIMSVRWVDGKPEYFEDYPKEAGEVLLTDDGEEGNIDTIDALARGEGNDVLLLKAELARKLEVSKGTAGTQADLLNMLGLDRAGVQVKGKSEQIIKDWTRGLENARTQIVKLLEEFREIRVEGDYNERKKARSTQIAKLEQLKGLLTQWQEGLDPNWMGRSGVPMTQTGEPNIAEITERQDAIRIAQQKDRR
jgi:hypothetical protein